MNNKFAPADSSFHAEARALLDMIFYGVGGFFFFLKFIGVVDSIVISWREDSIGTQFTGDRKEGRTDEAKIEGEGMKSEGGSRVDILRLQRRSWDNEKFMKLRIQVQINRGERIQWQL